MISLRVNTAESMGKRNFFRCYCGPRTTWLRLDYFRTRFPDFFGSGYRSYRGFGLWLGRFHVGLLLSWVERGG